MRVKYLNKLFWPFISGTLALLLGLTPHVFPVLVILALCTVLDFLLPRRMAWVSIGLLSLSFFLPTRDQGPEHLYLRRTLSLHNLGTMEATFSLTHWDKHQKRCGSMLNPRLVIDAKGLQPGEVEVVGGTKVIQLKEIPRHNAIMLNFFLDQKTIPKDLRVRVTPKANSFILMGGVAHRLNINPWTLRLMMGGGHQTNCALVYYPQTITFDGKTVSQRALRNIFDSPTPYLYPDGDLRETPLILTQSQIDELLVHDSGK